MLYGEAERVRKKLPKKVIPLELADRQFYKFCESRCIYCNGTYDQDVPRRLSVFVKPYPFPSRARWTGPLFRSRVRKVAVEAGRSSRIREASPDSVFKKCLEEVTQ